MNRRELFGALGAVPVCGIAAADGHEPAKGGAGPLAGPHLHFCGIHMAKKDPKFQLVT